jgi:phosphoribosyl-ATP pyrophosphohydrolase/phosphoribosyl-AMP cyclohydrolase
MIDTLNFNKLNGLIPAVVQDSRTSQVLMLGFMNRAAVEATLNDKRVTFFSRTTQRLWQKGETSGNMLELVTMQADCDNDSLLIKAKPRGPVCHSGSFTCFGEARNEVAESILRSLESTIENRSNVSPEKSYTARLLQDGTARIAQKVGEEAVEVVVSSMQPGTSALAEESADLLYHLLVLLRSRGILLSDVTSVLERRMKR